jgi:hypothetical protein
MRTGEERVIKCRITTESIMKGILEFEAFCGPPPTFVLMKSTCRGGERRSQRKLLQVHHLLPNSIFGCVRGFSGAYLYCSKVIHRWCLPNSREIGNNH